MFEFTQLVVIESKLTCNPAYVKLTEQLLIAIASHIVKHLCEVQMINVLKNVYR